MLITSQHNCTRDMHLAGHNNTHGTWCQGHTEKLKLSISKCQTESSCQFHIPATSLPRKQLPVPID